MDKGTWRGTEREQVDCIGATVRSEFWKGKQ